MSSRRIADTAIAVMLAALGADIVLKIVSGRASGSSLSDWFFVPIVAVGSALYAGIGRLIVARQPRNTIGWLLLAIPLAALLSLLNGTYAMRTLVASPGSLPFGVLSAWVDRWALVGTLAIFVPIFLLYPDGRLPSARWRWVMVATIAAPVVTIVAFALTPGQLTGAFADLTSVRVDNPVGIAAAKDLIHALTLIGGSATLLTAVAAGVAIVARFRRADVEVRQQIRWLALVAVLFFVWLVIGMVGSGNDVIGNSAFLLMFLTLVIGIPVACGIAILRYRLYDLDVVVSRAIVYGALAAFTTLVYVVLVILVGRTIGVGSSSLPLSIAATAVVAVAFQPLRERLQRLANRLVYGKRSTPYEVLASFSDRVAEAYATEDVLPRMARVLAEGVHAARAVVWLRLAERFEAVASWPAGDGGGDFPSFAVPSDGTLPPVPGDHVASVRYRDELLGALAVDKARDEPLTPDERALLDDLASQAGLVLANVRMTADLEARLRTIERQAAELKASRQRIVAAQDAERRRLERNIHDGAQQHLVALAVKLRLVKGVLTKDPPRARSMIVALRDEVGEGLDTLHALALGIYPPLLEERGIAAALADQYVRAGLPVRMHADGLSRHPIEIEAAVYFCVLEALQNAAKYAQASAIDLTLSQRDHELTFEVRDDGVGFDPVADGNGTGLAGMRDRLGVLGGDAGLGSAPGRGTVITGRVPLDRAEAAV